MDSTPVEIAPSVSAIPVERLDAESGAVVGGKPYYEARPNITPINPKYVIWEKMRGGRFPSDEGADDAAEGRGAEKVEHKDTRRSRNDEDAAAALEKKNNADSVASTSTSHPPPSPDASERDAKRTKIEGMDDVVAAATVPVVLGEDGEPIKKVKLSGAQKKHAKKAAESIAWNLRKDEIERVKAANKAAGIVVPKQKERGQNKGRRFDRRAGESDIKLCLAVAQGKVCERIASNTCRWSHDLVGYLAARDAEIPIVLPASVDDLDATTSTERICPLFTELGECPQGYKCRFGGSHMRKVGAGEGDAGSEWVLVVDQEKVAKLALVKGEGLSEIRDKGEMNVITMSRIKEIRGQGVAKELRFPLAVEYLTSIGEALDGREFATPGEGRNSGDRKGKNKKAQQPVANAGVYVVNEDDDDDMLPPPPPAVVEPVASTSAAAEIAPTPIDIDSDPSRSYVPDLAPIRAGEKKSLDFRGKLYLAPLTTVGNLPFRRLCGTLGNDISCSEMGLAQEFLAGNSSEWSLVRRHPSEKMFGVQICGSRPQALVPAAEAIVKSCDIDFLDVNCGCPIDLVFNKGGGSALLAHAGKLGKSLAGMSKVLGEIPLTIKIRNGISNTSPVAHKLVTRMQTEWGVSAVTLHGRSRQQRYKTKADYAYIAQVARSLRDTASDAGLKPIPIFGNGDAYDYRTYYDNMEASGVDGIMIARGALVKPWIFTEIKEKRDWDISSRERLDLIGQLAQFGIEHWGSDTVGLNTARRFLCEAISFQHRYVPVGLLDHLPANLNDRAYPYRGRDELETLLASEQSSDWVKITSMFLGPPPDDWTFLPKHKANASDSTEIQG